MRRILIVFLLLLSFASIGFAESLDCLCDDCIPFQAKSWEGFCAIGNAELCPTDDPDEAYIATRLLPNVREWALLKIVVNSK